MTRKMRLLGPAGLLCLVAGGLAGAQATPAGAQGAPGSVRPASTGAQAAPAPASPGAWSRNLVPASAAVSSEITTSRTLRIDTRPIRGTGHLIDVGSKGFGPGDYTVFSERLYDARSGKLVGRDDSTCLYFTAQGPATCSGTFRIFGRGTIEIQGSVPFRLPFVFSVVGGTGDFQNVRGEAVIPGFSGPVTHFVFRLLP